MIIRKTIMIQETINTDEHGESCDPITRVAAIAIVENPLAGRYIQDPSPAPRPDEIVLCMAIADGGRPHPRVGSSPVAV